MFRHRRVALHGGCRFKAISEAFTSFRESIYRRNFTFMNYTRCTMGDTNRLIAVIRIGDAS